MKRLTLLTAVLALSVVGASQSYAQGKPKGLRAAIHRADAAVDSSQFKVEFGSDLRALKTGDSLPADVRIGLVVSNAFTVEGSVAAQQDSGYIEADVSLGVTASLFPGSTNYHGQFAFASPVLHYEGGAFQPGIKFGTGTRQVASTSAGMLARVSAGLQHLFQRGALPARNQAFIEVGISFLK